MTERDDDGGEDETQACGTLRMRGSNISHHEDESGRSEEERDIAKRTQVTEMRQNSDVEEREGLLGEI